MKVSPIKATLILLSRNTWISSWCFLDRFQIQRSHRLERDCVSAHYFVTSTVKVFQIAVINNSSMIRAPQSMAICTFVLVVSLHSRRINQENRLTQWNFVNVGTSKNMQ